MTERREWFENKKQNLDIYESILMSEAGCMEGILLGNVFSVTGSHRIIFWKHTRLKTRFPEIIQKICVTTLS